MGWAGHPQTAPRLPRHRRHLYLLGATGTGKTNLLLRLIESDIHKVHWFNMETFGTARPDRYSLLTTTKIFIPLAALSECGQVKFHL